MLSRHLRELIVAAQKTGWTVGDGSLGDVRLAAQVLKMEEVPIRRGAPPVTTLRPTERAAANRNSLSAKYGTGEQPLHTDGAHLVDPPDILVLASIGTNITPTLLWKRPIPFTIPGHLSHGIFLVCNGAHSFFSVAYSGGRLRYDPGCMVPGDARAREASAFFEEQLGAASAHNWDKPNKILIIDNRHVLHARASAANDSGRELNRIAFRLRGDIK